MFRGGTVVGRVRIDMLMGYPCGIVVLLQENLQSMSFGVVVVDLFGKTVVKKLFMLVFLLLTDALLMFSYSDNDNDNDNCRKYEEDYEESEEEHFELFIINLFVNGWSVVGLRVL